jgi:hypothetical protein
MTRVRSWLLGVVVAVVIVLAMGFFVLVNGGRLPWTDTGSCDLPGSVAVGPASDASGIQVVEQGFTQSADYRLSIGAVLSNTGRTVAYRTRVSFQAFDPTQRPFDAPTVVEVPVLLPGQRIGIGQDTQMAVGTRVASVRVVPDSTHHLAAGALGSYRPVTATRPRTSHPDPLVAAHVDIHYTDTSTNCGPLLDGAAAVVYRDAHGTIIGGAVDTPGSLIVYRDGHGVTVAGEFHPPASGPCEPGTRDMWLTPSGAQPAAADPARTAVYPYCGVPSVVPASGSPTLSP